MEKAFIVCLYSWRGEDNTFARRSFWLDRTCWCVSLISPLLLKNKVISGHEEISSSPPSSSIFGDGCGPFCVNLLDPNKTVSRLNKRLVCDEKYSNGRWLTSHDFCSKCLLWERFEWGAGVCNIENCSLRDSQQHCWFQNLRREIPVGWSHDQHEFKMTSLFLTQTQVVSDGRARLCF